MAYLPIIVFLLLAIAAVAVEATWLTRRGWTTIGKAWIFAISTDVIGLGLGGFVSFAIFGIMLMMVFGPNGEGGNSSEASYWALTIPAVTVPPLILVFFKRIVMPLLRMPGGRPAWLFSLVAGVSAAATVALPPPVVYYLLSKYAY